MSKRKNRKSSTPNLPQETLERARQEAGLSPVEPRPSANEDDIDDEVVSAADAAPSAPNPDTSRQRDMPLPPQTNRRKRKPKPLTYEEMTQEEVAHALENPTKIVTEAELRIQYSYVLMDIRSMAILAAVLFVALIIIAAVFI